MPNQSFKEWLVVGFCALVIGAYWGGLRVVRRRVRAMSKNAKEYQTPHHAGDITKGIANLSEDEIERYSRHIFIREIGGAGQKKLKQSRVLVIGAGGLGSSALLYLASSGVGTIGVVDDDVVELSNLQRQIIHQNHSLGQPKVISALEHLKTLNPHIMGVAHQCRFNHENALDLMAGYDLILDGSDNFNTRYLVNRCCVSLNKPLVSGAMSQWEGQVFVFDPVSGGPCYECIFPHMPSNEIGPSCAESGVVAPLPGVIGSIMALEAIKYLIDIGQRLDKRLMIYDALYAETRLIKVDKRDSCPICFKGV